MHIKPIVYEQEEITFLDLTATENRAVVTTPNKVLNCLNSYCTTGSYFRNKPNLIHTIRF